ncbi:MAG: DUF1724 domain-containing protein [Candidatus Bathyarchaeota archaeon]|nr:DUF1724 domain-containing protein [Candidatus Bathyarchaeota archaeon]
MNIISSLLGEKKRLSVLRDELGSSGSTIIHALQDLEAINLTRKVGKNYKLTSLGVMQALLIEEASSAVDVLERFQEFWLQHDVTAIPGYLLQRIGALQEASLIRDNTIELDRVHSTFQQLLLSSRRVRGLSPIFHSDYIGAFQRLLSEGANVELVLTRDVLSRTLSLADSQQLIDYVMKDKLRVYLADELRVALTVTENSFSIGLFTNEGQYDYSQDLVSDNQKAIEWGEELFRHYLKEAKRLDLGELNLI